MKSAGHDFPGRVGSASRNREPATTAYPASTFPAAKAPTCMGAKRGLGERGLKEPRR